MVRDHTPLINLLGDLESGMIRLTMTEYLDLPVSLIEAWRILKAEKEKRRSAS